MKEYSISNKSLATLLVVALVVSICGSWIAFEKSQGFARITGAPTLDTGTATVTIEASGSVRFAVNAINFGTGKVNASAGNTQCILDSNGTNDSNRCINFTQQFGNLSLENDGSTNVTVQLVSNKDAVTFLGGASTLAMFRYVVQNNETDSCRNGSGGGGAVTPTATMNCTMGVAGSTAGNCTVYPVAWADVNTTAPGSTICMRLLANNTDDSIGIDINISIPYDAPAGVKTATFTATATTITT